MNKGTQRILILGAIVLGIYFLFKGISNAANTVANKIPNFDLGTAFGDTVSAGVTATANVATGLTQSAVDTITTGIGSFLSNGLGGVFSSLDNTNAGSDGTNGGIGIGYIGGDQMIGQ